MISYSELKYVECKFQVEGRSPTLIYVAKHVMCLVLRVAKRENNKLLWEKEA